MAEKEVCAELLETTTQETSNNQLSGGGLIQGESLLLPLLQGLLDAPEPHTVDQTADSGTESGEDLRSGLIVEVQSALDKLAACLTSDATDITNERRDSLLQLVSKLQANLTVGSTTNTNSAPVSQRQTERRSSGSSQGRFSKRRQRQNRHTVGVTSEELEDARRLMEEISLRELHTSTSATVVATPTVITNPLQKQNSESSVQTGQALTAFRPVKFQPHKSLSIKNATAKPYNGSNNTSSVNSQTPSGTSSTVETPTEASESLELLFPDPQPVVYRATLAKSPRDDKHIYRQSLSLDHEGVLNGQKRPLQQTVSLDFNTEVDVISVQQAVQQAAAIKQLSQTKNETIMADSETDEDPSTIKAQNINTVDLFYHSVPSVNNNQQPDLLLQSNPIFVNASSDNISEMEKQNRFNSKKLKMKRANTIDIPKPVKCYVDENESEDDDHHDSRRNHYLSLRGPINVGKFTYQKNVPPFEAKTESDRKFMAFINKQNDDCKPNSVLARTSIWDKHIQAEQDQAKQTGPNWSRKFGNIKTTFERAATFDTASNNRNSARGFWKSADDAGTAGSLSYNGPKISKQSARNLQKMFEEKQKQNKTPWTAPVHESAGHVVKGSLKVEAKVFEQSKKQQPVSVNMFSHAPMSAFKPIQKNSSHQVPSTNNIKTTKHTLSAQTSTTTEPGTPESPMYLYSPKLFPSSMDVNSSNNSSIVNSPTVKTAPWGGHSNNFVTSSAESRVKNIAAAKFENAVENNRPVQNHRRPSNEKVSLPKYLQQSTEKDAKVLPSYIAYSASSNAKPTGGSVRKISGQYNNRHENETEQFLPKHQSAFANVPQSSKFYENQQLPYTHSIRYSQPKVPFNNQYYSQVDEVPVPKVKPEQTYTSKVKYQSKVETPEPHVYYNNVQSSRSNHQPNRHSMIEQDHNREVYNHTRPKSPHFPTQNGHSHYETPNNMTYNSYASQSVVKSPETFRDYADHYVQPTISPTNHPNPIRNDVSPYQISPSDYEEISSPTRLLNEIRTITSPPLSPKLVQTIPKYESQVQTVPKYESQVSVESVHEYNAVNSRVMTGPVGQQAISMNNTPKNRNQHDMDAAFNLKSALQKIDKKGSVSPRPEEQARTASDSNGSEEQIQPRVIYNNVRYNESNRGRDYNEDIVKPKSSYSDARPKLSVHSTPNFLVNDKPLESLEINERGESIVTSKFHIPVKTVKNEPFHPVSPRPSHGQALSKSDSWHQVCQQASLSTPPGKPSPRSSPSARNIITKSKSTHTLALPKQYEAGMSRDEMTQKKMTVEAYFAGSKSPQLKTFSSSSGSKQRTINRTKTAEKTSIMRQSTSSSSGLGLSRSRTLPDIVCADMLDESNVDEAFEDLFKSSA